MRKDIKNADRYCKFCEKKLERKRFASGRLEDFGVFSQRVYCGRECMRKAFLKTGRNDQSWSNAHTSARLVNQLYLHKESCEICGSTGKLDIHHLDNDYQNNNLENLKALCRSCHMKLHRLKGLCKVCGKPMKGLGYCDKHYQRYKKYGDPMIVGKCNGQIIESES